MQLQPIWQNLPLKFKLDAVRKLDYKSRLSLQKCSKSDRDLVLSVPFFLKYILLNTSPEEVERSIRHTKSEVMINEHPFGGKALYWKTEDHEVTIDILSLLIKNPNANFEEMIVNTKKNPAIFVKQFLEKLGDSKIGVKILYWTSGVKIAKTTKERDNCSTFFKLFDTNKLEKLELNIPQKRLIGELMKTDQFKRSRQIHLKSEIENRQLDSVLHANELRIQLGQLPAGDLKKLIEVFLQKKQGSFFKVIIVKGEIDFTSIQDSIKTMPKNSLLPSHHFYEMDIVKYRFEIEERTSPNGEKLILYLNIGKRSAMGAVCRADHVHADTVSIY